MNFPSSDLAAECAAREENGVRIRHAMAQGCEITYVRIDSEEAAARIGKPRGRYVTVECGDLCAPEAQVLERVARVISVEMREMARRMCEKPLGEGFFVLVIGLGNAEMTPDALGPKTVKLLPVTRHLPRFSRGELVEREACDLAAISTGVVAQTGIETAEILRGIVTQVHPDLVVAVDALAARSPERLASTVQLCDSGIQPGAGVGNARLAITRESVGVPVMAVGVPTVINGAMLLRDVLEGERSEKEAAQEKERLRSLFVCPREIDLLVGQAAALVARALERAFYH